MGHDDTTRRAGLAGLQERLAECSPEEIAMLIPREVLLEALGPVKFNMNETVKVELTACAEGVWSGYWERFLHDLPHLIPPLTNRLPLHEVAHVFGPTLSPGQEHAVSMEIELSKVR